MKLSRGRAGQPSLCLPVIVTVTYINGGLGVLQDTVVQNKKTLQRKTSTKLELVKYKQRWDYSGLIKTGFFI